MADFIFRTPTKNIGNFKIPLVMEIHQSLFTEEFKNFEIRDFLPAGEVYGNPKVLNASEKITDCISKCFYVVSPFHQKVFDNGHVLGGHVYLVDGDNGIEVYHREPVKQNIGKN